MVNEIALQAAFRRSILGREFAVRPFGFVDAGAMEGVHPLVEPVASVTDAVCFEPHPVEYDRLARMYRCDNPYARVTVYPAALWSRRLTGKAFFVTRKVSASSLLPPKTEFIRRYDAVNFTPVTRMSVRTVTLDEALDYGPLRAASAGEFLKLDTQGAEYEILKGAKRTLESKTVAVWCEARFMETYRGEKLLSDIERLLRPYGFCLYGLYPHYRSTKSFNRRAAHTEERLMWADAVFFKDPLESRRVYRRMRPRSWRALILSALLTRYYDFAVELSEAHLKGVEKIHFIRFLRALASEAGKSVSRRTRTSYRRAIHLVSDFKTNSDIDYILSR